MSSKPYSAKDVTPSLPTPLDTQQPYTQAEGEKRIEDARAFAQAGVTAQAEAERLAQTTAEPGAHAWEGATAEQIVADLEKLAEQVKAPPVPLRSEGFKKQLRDRIMGQHYDEPEMRDRVMSHYDRLTLRRLERERPHDLGQGVELRPFSWRLKRSRVIEVSENEAHMRGLSRRGEYGAQYVRVSLYVDVLHVDSGEPVEVVVDKTIPYYSPAERAHKIRDMLLEALRHEVDELFFYEGRRLHEPHPEQHWMATIDYGYQPPPVPPEVKKALEKVVRDALPPIIPEKPMSLEDIKKEIGASLEKATAEGLIDPSSLDQVVARKVAAAAKLPVGLLFGPNDDARLGLDPSSTTCEDPDP